MFSGLPGVGKSTVARELARSRSAVLVRIDTIEPAMRGHVEDIGATGYSIGYRLASDNLRVGSDVMADSVNPLPVARGAWRQVAERSAAAFVEIEIMSSDVTEHRRRVEGRTTDVQGLRLPTWADVQRREDHAWHEPRAVLDTAGRSVRERCAELRTSLSAVDPGWGR